MRIVLHINTMLVSMSVCVSVSLSRLWRVSELVLMSVTVVVLMSTSVCARCEMRVLWVDGCIRRP